MSATTDLIIRYQESDNADRAALRSAYPEFFGSNKKPTAKVCSPCKGTGIINRRQYSWECPWCKAA